MIVTRMPEYHSKRLLLLLLFLFITYLDTVSVTQALATNGVSTSQPCVDTSASLLSCADMKSLGYCDPVAGAGYALAQIRCPLTCGFCVI